MWIAVQLEQKIAEYLQKIDYDLIRPLQISGLERKYNISMGSVIYN